jgi:hypothetical protein
MQASTFERIPLVIFWRRDRRDSKASAEPGGKPLRCKIVAIGRKRGLRSMVARLKQGVGATDSTQRNWPY